MAAFAPGSPARLTVAALLAAALLAPLPCRAATSRVSVQFYWGGAVAVGGLTIAFWVSQSFDLAGMVPPRVEPALLNLERNRVTWGLPALRLRGAAAPVPPAGAEKPPSLELDLLRIGF